MWQVLGSLKKLVAANPMGLFLWGIIGKWYIMIIISSLVVLFWVTKGLKEVGFIDYVTESVEEILDTTKGAAQNCIPKLGADWDHLVRFWHCLGNPPKYEPNEELTGEGALKNRLNNLLPNKDKTPQEQQANPYDNSGE
ncbi:MAG: DUF2670 domain-containing protein [Rickettsia endosymbiont of Bryobia graminum]|nr:DUF2670 domain-containing protein [Rickettsia endosymbiont of Bryobia graminum]